MLLTVSAQFAVHLTCLVFLCQESEARGGGSNSTTAGDNSTLIGGGDDGMNATAGNATASVDVQAQPFKPSLLNSTVYLMSVALQLSTFAVNYRVSLAARRG